MEVVYGRWRLGAVLPSPGVASEEERQGPVASCLEEGRTGKPWSREWSGDGYDQKGARHCSSYPCIRSLVGYEAEEGLTFRHEAYDMDSGLLIFLLFLLPLLP